MGEWQVIINILNKLISTDVTLEVIIAYNNINDALKYYKMKCPKKLKGRINVSYIEVDKLYFFRKNLTTSLAYAKKKGKLKFIVSIGYNDDYFWKLYHKNFR